MNINLATCCAERVDHPHDEGADYPQGCKSSTCFQRDVTVKCDAHIYYVVLFNLSYNELNSSLQCRVYSVCFGKRLWVPLII